MKTLDTTTPRSDTDIAKLFRAIADPTRLRIMCTLLEKRDLCVGELANEVGISTPGVSQHLKLLELHGLATPIRIGQRTCYKPHFDNPSARVLFDCIKTLKEE